MLTPARPDGNTTDIRNEYSASTVSYSSIGSTTGEEEEREKHAAGIWRLWCNDQQQVDYRELGVQPTDHTPFPYKLRGSYNHYMSEKY